jgi:hypothetical protein
MFRTGVIAMKQRFAKLSRAERKKVELEYNGTKPEDFDSATSRAKPHSPKAAFINPIKFETQKYVN